MGDTNFIFTVNAEEVICSLPAATPLLYYLRNDLGLNGPKFGCGLGQCGACTILVDGVATRSCITGVEDVKGSKVT
ncbi:Isoquinoline 1-oxidoreductase alpha subunit, partial [hydrothermal vent metagenome]